MSCHCNDLGLDELFDDEFAETDARKYLKRGLPPRARKLVSLIEQQTTVRGANTLEGGSGAGALTVELARRGARLATGIDAMKPAVDRARRLALETGAASAHFQQADFAFATSLPRADIVILDRVVCCYPDWQGLLNNAARASSRVIALSYPPANVFSRIEALGLNAFQRIMGRKFRLYLHSPARMRDFLQQRGFVMRGRRLFWIWELAVFTID